MRFSILLLALVAAAPAFAQPPPPLAGSRIALERGIEAPAVQRVAGLGSFDAETGAARSLYHLDWRGSGGTPREIAREFLHTEASRQRVLADPGGLVERSARTGRAGTVVRFAQIHLGYPVHGAEVAVTVSPGGAVTFLSSTAETALSAVENVPQLGAAAAADAARAYLAGSSSVLRAPYAVVIRHQRRTLVAFVVLLRLQRAPFGEWELLIDAESGEVLRARDTLFYADAAGRVFAPDPLSSSGASYGDSGYLDGADADTTELTAELVDVTLRDVTLDAGTYSLVGPYASCLDAEAPAGTCPTTSDGNFLYTRNSDDFEAVNVYHHIDSVLRHLNVDLGLDAVPYQYAGGARFDPRGLGGADNSSYSSFDGQLSFGEGGVDDAEDADVVIHELGHGIHDWVTGGSLSQVEGLSEGVGDYYAQSYSRSFGQWQPADLEYDWLFHWDGHNPFWGGRVSDWTDSHKYPDDLTGSIHTNGQFWSSCNMRIWDLLGRDATDTGMTEGLASTTGSTNQEDAAQAVLQAITNLGFGISQRQIFFLTYQGCGYTVTLPAAANEVAADGFETGDTCRWSASTSGCTG